MKVTVTFNDASADHMPVRDAREYYETLIAEGVFDLRRAFDVRVTVTATSSTGELPGFNLERRLMELV